MKKIFSVLIVICLFVACFSPAAYCENTDIISFGRIYVAMPQINVELKGTGFSAEEIQANLGGEQLKLADMHEFSPQQDSSRIFALVDISGSMKKGFPLVCQNVLSVAKNLGPEDELVLITFGGTDVEVLLQGGETQSEILNAVNSLTCTNGDTPFFEALNRAYQISNSKISSFDREYIIAFSDGVDIQVAATTYNEVVEQFKTHSLPLYAACTSYAQKDDVDRFGELARYSGGTINKIESEEDFAALTREISNVTICSFLAANNIADGSTRQLSVKHGSSFAEINVPVYRSIPDNSPPTVEEISFDTERNAFRIRFSEQVKGALDANKYKIENSANEVMEVSFVEQGDEENSVIVTIKGIKADTYTLSIKGVTDNSQQANPLTYSTTIEVTKVAEEEAVLPEPEKENSLPGWLIAVLVVLALVIIGAIVAVVLIASKKDNQEVPVNQVQGVAVKPIPGVVEYETQPVLQEQIHLKNGSAKKINLRVKTGSSSEHNTVTQVSSSLMVGRSDICDLYIDDIKLSRQHFVIENEDGNLFIQDLKSKNGTFLNGTRVSSRQLLHSGDKIVAGLSDIVITF